MGILNFGLRAQKCVAVYMVLAPFYCWLRHSFRGFLSKKWESGMGTGSLVLHKNVAFWFSFMDYFFPKLCIFCGALPSANIHVLQFLLLLINSLVAKG